MTLASALNSAMSGLRAVSRSTQLVSNNIANASTPGYARRTLSITANSSGDVGGVRINGVVRHVDQQIINDRRLSGAEVGYRTATSNALNRIEDLIGTPEKTGSISARLSDFKQSLITAASRPDASERLAASAFAAKDIVNAINAAATGISDLRNTAEQSIDAQVKRLNAALKGVQEMNGRIAGSGASGTETAALEDQRQILIDEISEIVPVRRIDRDNGVVALYSTGGAILLDGNAFEIDFEATTFVSPFSSIDDGSLSGLTINGFSIGTSSEFGGLSGGTLGAQFAIRDEISVEAQIGVDALARELVQRFEELPSSPTLLPGELGLFTDDGEQFDAANALGLANRLTLNSSVDPAKGAEFWRLRDGLQVAAPGESGDASGLNELVEQLDASRTPFSGVFGSAPLSLQGAVSMISSELGSSRLREDQRLSFATAQFTELQQLELSEGVDTDAELQRLLLLEQAYAANARVLSAVDEMFETLNRI